MIGKRCWSLDFGDDQLDDNAEGMSLPLLEGLHACKFHRCSILASAFDSLEDACALVQGLGIRRLDRDPDLMESYGFELLRWKIKVEPLLRHRRRRVAADVSEGRMNLLSYMSDGLMSAGSQVLPSVLEKVCVPVVWKNRRSRKLSGLTGLDERQSVEETERIRWGTRLIELVKNASLPLVAQSMVAPDPTTAMMSALGNLRSRTLRMRVKTWEKVALWMNIMYQVHFPRHVGDLLQYLEDVLASGCGKSVPGTIMAALIVLERTGGVPRSDKISENIMWVGAVAQAEAAIKSVQGATIHKASPFLLMMIISLELYVCSSGPRFKRGVAWLRLVKLFTCMRFDDTKGLRPSRLVLSDGGLRGVLERTKTTGAGRRTGELPIFIHRQAEFSGRD